MEIKDEAASTVGGFGAESERRTVPEDDDSSQSPPTRTSHSKQLASSSADRKKATLASRPGVLVYMASACDGERVPSPHSFKRKHCELILTPLCLLTADRKFRESRPFPGSAALTKCSADCGNDSVWVAVEARALVSGKFFQWRQCAVKR